MNDFELIARPVFALGLIIGLLWLWTKYGDRVEKWIKVKFPSRGIAALGRSVTVVENRRINRRSSVTVVDFGGERILLGVTDGQINKIHSIPAPEVTEEPAAEQIPAPTRGERVAFGKALKSASVTSLQQMFPSKKPTL